MLYRLLPVLLLISAITFVGLNFQSFKRNIVYRLGISDDITTSCCTESEVSTSTGDFDEVANLAIFNSEIINYPKTSLAHQFSESIAQSADEDEVVLGTTNAAGEEKWIEVSLPDQRLRAWEGSRLVMEFPISAGKWAPTPSGTFHIWYKTRSQKMSGGSKELGTYYYLPNVPHNMFFHKGYAIHGAYWHNNFGQPMSHGCVNEPLANASQIFEWAGPYVSPEVNAVRATPENPGTRVLVH